MKDRLELELTKRRDSYIESVGVLAKFSEAPKKDQNSEISSNFKLIETLGFTNSKCIQEKRKIMSDNASFEASIREALECVKFMKELVDYFGPETIVIRRSDMIDLIRKYGLKVGKFSDYTGTIPDKNLQEIKEADDKICNLKRGYGSPDYPLLSKAYSRYLGIITEIQMSGYRDSDRSWHEYRPGRKLKSELEMFPIVQIGDTSYYDKGREAARYIENLYPGNQRAEKINDVKLDDNVGRMFIIAKGKKLEKSAKA